MKVRIVEDPVPLPLSMNESVLSKRDFHLQTTLEKIKSLQIAVWYGENLKKV